MYRRSFIKARKYNDASPVSLHSLHSIAFLDRANSAIKLIVLDYVLKELQ